MHEIPDDTTDATKQTEAPLSETTEPQTDAVSRTFGITRSTMMIIIQERLPPGTVLRDGLSDAQIEQCYFGLIEGQY